MHVHMHTHTHTHTTPHPLQAHPDKPAYPFTGYGYVRYVRRPTRAASPVGGSGSWLGQCVRWWCSEGPCGWYCRQLLCFPSSSIVPAKAGLQGGACGASGGDDDGLGAGMTYDPTSTTIKPWAWKAW